MKKILIIRDNPLKTDEKLKTDFRCFIFCILLFIIKILPTLCIVYYIRQYVCDYVYIHRIVS